MNSYKAMKQRHQEEFNAFPMKYAFGAGGFEIKMKELGLSPSDTDKIYIFGDTGCFYLRSDAPALHSMLDRHEQERQNAIAVDKTGDGYIVDMFLSELASHEYNYTHDSTETLEALGLTYDQIEADPRLQHGFQKACMNLGDFFDVKGIR